MPRNGQENKPVNELLRNVMFEIVHRDSLDNSSGLLIFTASKIPEETKKAIHIAGFFIFTKRP